MLRELLCTNIVVLFVHSLRRDGPCSGDSGPIYILQSHGGYFPGLVVAVMSGGCIGSPPRWRHSDLESWLRLRLAAAALRAVTVRVAADTRRAGPSAQARGGQCGRALQTWRGPGRGRILQSALLPLNDFPLDSVPLILNSLCVVC